jgi:pimeloyl-ACP methyl ester carboxylesterase
MIFLIADWTVDPGAGARPLADTRRLAGVAGLHPLAVFRQCRLHSFREAGPDPGEPTVASVPILRSRRSRRSRRGGPTWHELPGWGPENLTGRPGCPGRPFRSSSASPASGGTPIHYLDEGSGPALLLVSAGQWSFMFRDVILRLRGQFRCLTLDFPGSGLSPNAPDHSVGANARILEGFIDALDLQDVTMVVHDAGGPAGFLVATRRPERFRALVISNTFGWPLAAHPAVRRTLRVVASRPFGAVNRLTNVMARFTASRYGVGRRMSKADRRSFLGPWRSRGCRRATWQVLAGLLRIDPVMASVERSLRAEFADLPVLTLSGARTIRTAGRLGSDGSLFRSPQPESTTGTTSRSTTTRTPMPPRSPRGGRRR